MLPNQEVALTTSASTPAADTVSEQTLAELRRTSVLYEIGREWYNPYPTEGPVGRIVPGRAASTAALKRSRTDHNSFAALDIAGLDAHGVATEKLGCSVTCFRKGHDGGNRFEDCMKSTSAPKGQQGRQPTVLAAGVGVGIEIVISEMCTMHRVSARVTYTPLPIIERKVPLDCGEIGGTQDLLNVSARQSCFAFGNPAALGHEVETIAEESAAEGSSCGIEGGNEHTVMPASRGLLIEFSWTPSRRRSGDKVKGGLRESRRACYFNASSCWKRVCTSEMLRHQLPCVVRSPPNVGDSGPCYITVSV